MRNRLTPSSVRDCFTGTISGDRKRYCQYKKQAISEIYISEIQFLDGSLANEQQIFYEGIRFKNANLKVGDKISFEARIKPTIESLIGEEGFRLSHPTKIRKISG